MMRNIPRHQYLLIFGIACVLAAVLVYAVSHFACEEGLNPSEIISRAQANMYAQSSYRYETNTHNEQGNSSTTKSMEYISPDIYHGKETGIQSWVEYIFLGDEKYYRASYHPEWITQPQFVLDDGTIRFVQIEITNDFLLLNMMDNAKELPVEKINSVDCYHYRQDKKPEIDIESEVAAYQKILSESGESEESEIDEAINQYRKSLELQSQTEMTFESWIGKEDLLVHQLLIVIKSPGGKEDEQWWNTTTILTKYYDFNEPFEIVGPENLIPEPGSTE